MKTKNKDIIMQNKVFLWIALVTGLILLVPFLAMQFSNEVNWDETDFIVIGILVFGVGSIFVLVARKIRKTWHRVAIGIVLLVTLFYIWAELAVGIFTNLGS